MPRDVNTNLATQDTTTLSSTSGLGQFPPESGEWRRRRSVLPYGSDVLPFEALQKIDDSCNDALWNALLRSRLEHFRNFILNLGSGHVHDLIVRLCTRSWQQSDRLCAAEPAPETGEWRRPRTVCSTVRFCTKTSHTRRDRRRNRSAVRRRTRTHEGKGLAKPLVGATSFESAHVCGGRHVRRVNTLCHARRCAARHCVCSELYVCVCVCMYVYMCKCMYVYVGVCMYMCVSVCKCM